MVHSSSRHNASGDAVHEDIAKPFKYLRIPKSEMETNILRHPSLMLLMSQGFTAKPCRKLNCRREKNGKL
ncbi:hypothetical protein V6N11_028711 [Hibiscus sabdariffa]|uniref:Uncharacterized protein n=1 Tax=Hibiscus sabdariffa TaxID=183260 RepID=A0ABR2PRF6_9ROSI